MWHSDKAVQAQIARAPVFFSVMVPCGRVAFLRVVVPCEGAGRDYAGLCLGVYSLLGLGFLWRFFLGETR